MKFSKNTKKEIASQKSLLPIAIRVMVLEEYISKKGAKNKMMYVGEI